MPNWKGYFEAKNEMESPVKDTKGYGYMYATLAQVKSIVDPACSAHGVGYTQRQCEGVLHTCVMDAESGEVMLEDTRRVADGKDQERGSSETYQRRYALLTVFGLAPEDDDGAAASQRAAQKAEPEAVRDPVKDERNRAVKRLDAALRAYCEKEGMAYEAVKAEVKARDDFMDSAAFYNKLAYEYEKATNG